MNEVVYLLDYLLLIMAILIIIVKLKQNQHRIKKLSKLQIAGVGLSYAVTLSLLVFCIYYVGNWFVSYFSPQWIQTVIFIIIVCITMFTGTSLLNKVINKIIKGQLS